jgi:hypothetical protein
VQHNTQKRIVDVDFPVVLDEAQFPEFIHEKIHTRPRRANHLCQHLLGYLRKRFLRMTWRAVVCEQQQSARQALFAGIKELVDQVLFNSYVSREHVRDEAIGKPVLSVERPHHLVFLNDEHTGRRDSSRCGHTNGLARTAP